MMVCLEKPTPFEITQLGYPAIYLKFQKQKQSSPRTGLETKKIELAESLLFYLVHQQIQDIAFLGYLKVLQSLFSLFELIPLSVIAHLRLPVLLNKPPEQQGTATTVLGPFLLRFS